ncbi:MAG: substrate-binding domain-containing protein [Chthoniobacterales bacterium]
MSYRVAVILHQTVPWLSQCVDGIRSYVQQEEADWSLIHLSPGFQRFQSIPSLPRSQQWKGDGIISLVDEAKELRAATKGKIPVVNLGSWNEKSFGIRRVMVDHHRGGEMAAEHLLGLGLRQFAVFGWSDAWYQRERQRGFCERACRSGIHCIVQTESSRHAGEKSWFQRITQAVRWIKTLPRPCGIFVVHDYMAQLIAEACHEAGFQVPDDVSLISMDNDEAICEHLVPKLTSIDRSSFQVGWEAAALLDRLMRGEICEKDDVLVPPQGIVSRASTGKLYSSDPLVQQALDTMQKLLQTPFNIEQLSEDLGVSKKTLELGFREHLQTSPHHFLTTLRVRKAQELIRLEPKKTLEQIAEESGLGSAQVLRKAFQRVIGESISSFRKSVSASL